MRSPRSSNLLHLPHLFLLFSTTAATSNVSTSCFSSLLRPFCRRPTLRLHSVSPTTSTVLYRSQFQQRWGVGFEHMTETHGFLSLSPISLSLLSILSLSVRCSLEWCSSPWALGLWVVFLSGSRRGSSVWVRISTIPAAITFRSWRFGVNFALGRLDWRLFWLIIAFNRIPTDFWVRSTSSSFEFWWFK